MHCPVASNCGVRRVSASGHHAPLVIAHRRTLTNRRERTRRHKCRMARKQCRIIDDTHGRIHRRTREVCVGVIGKRIAERVRQRSVAVTHLHLHGNEKWFEHEQRLDATPVHSLLTA